MSISDELMWKYIDLLSFKTGVEIAEMKKSAVDGANPRDIKINFAKEIVTRFHDKDQAESSHQAFVERFQNKVIPDDMEAQVLICEVGCNIAQLLKQSNLTKSTSESMRLINQGAVKVNGERISDSALVFPGAHTYIIQVGKHRLAKVKLETKK